MFRNARMVQAVDSREVGEGRRPQADGRRRLVRRPLPAWAEALQADARHRARLDGLTQVAGQLGPAGVPLDAALLEAQVEMFGADLAGAPETPLLVGQRARQAGPPPLLPLLPAPPAPGHR